MQVTMIECDKLQGHPRNYREHPDDQLAHIKQSLTQFGFYRNVVATKENVILAGHGVVKAAKDLGIKKVPVMKVDLDPESTAALKILTGDNEIASLGIVDDRELTNMLKQIRDDDEHGLLGTGFDDQVLANLVMVTRTGTEVEDFDAAAEWVGMPEYDGEAQKNFKLLIKFETKELRDEFLFKQCEADKATQFKNDTVAIWYPPKTPRDMKSIEFRDKDDKAVAKKQ